MNDLMACGSSLHALEGQAEAAEAHANDLAERVIAASARVELAWTAALGSLAALEAKVQGMASAFAQKAVQLARDIKAALAVSRCDAASAPPAEEANPAPAADGRGHILYRNGDKDAPEGIKDGCGQVVLGMCRRCGKWESELDEACVPQPMPPLSRTDRQRAIAHQDMLDVHVMGQPFVMYPGWPPIPAGPLAEAEFARQWQRWVAEDRGHPAERQPTLSAEAAHAEAQPVPDPLDVARNGEGPKRAKAKRGGK